MTRTVLGYRLTDKVPAPDFKARKIKSSVKRAVKANTGRPSRYPYNLMEVGESFFLPAARSNDVTSAVARFAGKQFVTRSLTHRGVEGIRIWRVQ